MRVLLVLGMAFVFASAAFTPAPAAAQALPTGTLEGYVCATYPGETYPDDPGGDGYFGCYSWGVKGATVRVQGAGVAGSPVGATDRTVQADDSGHFIVTQLADGAYTVKASRPGFEDGQASATVEGGRGQAEVSLEGRKVTVVGRVTNEAGKGIANAELHFWGPDYGLQNPVRASKEGNFEARVLAGPYSISVNAPGYQAHYEERFLDGADPQDFELDPVPPQDATLVGRVADQDGQPVADARVGVSMYGDCCYAEGDGGEAVMAPVEEKSSRPYYGGENYTYTDAGGQYRINVYSGSGYMTVTKEGHATRSMEVRVATGETQEQDVELLKFPPKTARIVGQVTGLDGGLANVYVNVRSPAYGLSECSVQQAEATASGGGSAGSPGVASDVAIYPDPYYQGCTITVDSDGNFEGTVTPGYTILNVYHDHWSTCTFDDDGRVKGCGPEYFSFSRTLALPADQETRIDVRLAARPAPDAEASGYVLDAETGEPVEGAEVSFSNQETYGWGGARTDQDGSYRLRLRSGYHTVHIYAEGYLSWEGVLDVQAGDNPFDVRLTQGQESYGHCCYPYPMYAAGAAEDGQAASHSSKAGGGMGGMALDDTAESAGGGDGSGRATGYEDLGGGLGPYDAEERKQAQDEAAGGKGTPGPALGLLALALVASVLALRRRA